MYKRKLSNTDGTQNVLWATTTLKALIWNCTKQREAEDDWKIETNSGESRIPVALLHSAAAYQELDETNFET